MTLVRFLSDPVLLIIAAAAFGVLGWVAWTLMRDD